MKHNLKYILSQSEVSALELFLALILTLFSMWILSPWWNTFESSSFAIMRQLMTTPADSEIVWGSLGAFAGLLSFLSVAYGFKVVRKVSLALSAFFWICVAVTITIANANVTAVPVYSLMALTNLYLLIFRNQS